ncbi:branched-chain amino acid transaminase [Flavobacterium sp. 20NA77.7]|uniref:Branched-chain-amino-acid aminotransferase n=1 Tax=Flavobacterium nakdongensis TaxID=3073563 RepID=A0ABY9R7J3_9FLAO|nr:branched-chain amino acid transaminase [Flavobacterium sp. 20NA77.7]WMW76936.1 branched-chain amino acid transaminase [Flavobacterium sp. 20NA77.7]
MYFNENTIIYWNGNFVKAKEVNVNLYNQTMHYGNGVFEGIRAYDTPDGTRIFKSKEHYERLHYSARKMHINFDIPVKDLEKITYDLLRINNLKNAYIRPLVYLGENMSLSPTADVNLVIMAWEWGNYLGDKLLKVMLSSYQRPNPLSCYVQAKVVGHYTNSILATTEAKSRGFDEALLTDSNGFIAEGPGANFFIEKDGKLFTPPLGNILAGITRATVFEIAKELGFEVIEKLFLPEEIFQAESAFFCGTAAEVIGLRSFNEHIFPLAWEESIGAYIQKSYKIRVVQNEFQNVFI